MGRYILTIGIALLSPLYNFAQTQPEELQPTPFARFETYNMIQIAPQIVKVFPQDSFDLELVAKQTPAYWGPLSTFKLQSDYSILVTGTYPDAARGGLQLRSGSGSATWTLDSLFLPGASDSLEFLIGVNAPSGGGGNIVSIKFNSTQYKLYDDTGLISTVSYTAASGDKIKLGVDGGTIRIYINDREIYRRTYSSTNPYPVRYLAYANAALASAPSTNRIAAPTLIGDWQTTESYSRWYVPATLGSYTVNTQGYVATVTAGTTPGEYLVYGILGMAGDLNVGFTNTVSNTVFTTGSPLAVNDPVIFGTTPGQTLPGGITEGLTYYVKTFSAGNLSISTTVGGAAVDITTAGTGGWVAKVSEYELQSAAARVIIPAFDVLGLPATNTVQLKPGETRRFLTTYDDAQSYTKSNYITRSATGGSFDGSGLYTAPTTAGTYTLTFSSNGQSRVFYVLVEPYIKMVDSKGRTFDGNGNIAPIAPGEVVTFQTNMSGTVTYTVVGGTAGSTTTGGGITSLGYTAPAVLKQRCRVTATNGTKTLYMNAVVLDVLPVSLSATYEGEGGGEVVSRTAEDGVSNWSTSLTPVGVRQESISASINGMTNSEWASFLDFHEGTDTVAGYFHTQEAFFITDEQRYSRLIVRFDSKYSFRVEGCLTDASFRLARVDVNQI